MTLAERARIATATRQQTAAQRAESLRRLLSEGEPLKRAAWRVGVSCRTARRYRKMGVFHVGLPSANPITELPTSSERSA